MKNRYRSFKHITLLLFAGVCFINMAYAQFPAPYCNITFPSNNSDVGPITLVEFAGFNNPSSATVLASGINQLEDYTAISGNVTPGQSYSIRVKGNTDGPYGYYVTAFFDWNKNNVFTDAGEAVNVGIINSSTGVDAVQVTANIAVPPAALIGTTRMRVTFKYAAYATSCNNTGWGQAEDYTLKVGGLATNNAGVSSVSPVNMGFCAGNQDVKARIANKGNNLISFVNVNWEVDGVPQSPVFWNNPIDTAGSPTGNDTLITLGNISFVTGTAKNIKVWTSLPNSQQDTVPADDTVSVSLNAKLNCAFLPAYCTPTFTSYTSCIGGSITNVTFAGINNTVACLVGGGYRDYSNSILAPKVSVGQSYPVSVTIGTGTYKGGAAIWMDFNRNGTFEASEQVLTGTYNVSNPTPFIYSGTIVIPSSATSGYVMMRVMGREAATPTTPCGGGYGEAQDYLIYVGSKGPNNASVSAIEPVTQSFCAGNRDIKARIKNNGTNVISFVTINWELDGIAQSAINWGNPIDTFGGTAVNDTLLVLGTVNFVTGVPHTIKAWTSFPNGAQDTVPGDDTVFVSLSNSTCTPIFPLPYCNLSNTPAQVLPITLVNVATINNTSSAAATTPPALENFTAISANVWRGQAYPITVKANTDGAWHYFANVFIDWNHNNVFTDAGESYNIGDIYNSTGLDAVLVTANIMVPMGALYGSTRMRVMLNYNSYNTTSCDISSSYGQAEDYTLEVVPRVSNNAGVTRLVSPQNYCAGTQDIKVRVANLGSNAIGVVSINWELDGIPQTPVTWNTAIDTLGSVAGNDTVVWLGNVLFAPGVAHTIRTWTSFPNNVQDPSTSDDTLLVTTKPSLNGSYVIGVAPSDYASITSALNDLNTYGVCGPVEFLIKTGTYTSQQLLLNDIPGASSANTITITSAANHRDSVVISNNSGSSGNYLLKLNGTKYVTVKNISFTALNTVYGNVIELSAGASFDTIINCSLTSQVTTGSSTSLVLLYANSFTGKRIVFSNNVLSNGSYGIYWVGLSTLYTDSCTIKNNIVRNSSYSAMYFYYNSNLLCNSNKITPAAAASYGIYCLYTSNALEMNGNNISGQNAGYGIQLRYINGSASVRALVANNSIAVGNGTGTSYGLWCRDANYARFYNNTVNVASTGASSVPGYFYFSSAAYSNNEIKNNVLANNGGNYAMYNYLPVNTICNYNNLYTTSGSSFVQTSTGNYAGLAAWRSATGQDARSVSYRPGFTSNSNLTPNVTDSAVWSLNGRALHIPQVASSINNLARPAAYADGAPDIGAYEFTPVSLPPAALAIPATPLAGITQTFLFAGDTVARITWDASSNVPPAFSLRQASGEKAPFVFSEPNYTNFYLQSDMAAGNYWYTIDIPYHEGWRGTQVNEHDSRLYARNNSLSYMFNSTSIVDSAANIMSGIFYQEWKYYTGTDLYSPIPVKLVSFSAGRDKKDVVLAWSTASEINNKGFEIERSFDGVLFEPIRFVDARKNTASLTSYAYTDMGAFKRENISVLYYRLKQIDLDGERTYSDVVNVTNTQTGNEGISIYPNPYVNTFTVNIVSSRSSDATIEIYDLGGKLVYTEKAEVNPGDNRLTFDKLQHLDSGVYFVKVTSGEEVSVSRLIKTR